MISTYSDMIAYLVQYLGGNATKESLRDARLAVQNAYREFASVHAWSYYYDRLHLTTVAPVSAGTVAYDQTGGAYERMVTLTDSTWPDWASYGQIVLDNVIYEVAERKSNTVITLGVRANPGSDIAAGSPYTLYRDSYPLPADFVSMDELIVTSIPIVLRYVHPRDWLSLQRVIHSPANPRWYCCMGSSDYLGIQNVRFYPPPDNVYQIDGIMRRRPRPLIFDNYATGTVSLTSGSATVTGASTGWTSRMVGSVFRMGTDPAESPTGPYGANPPSVEQMVVSVASATSLTLDSASSVTVSDKPYQISDPVDIEDGSQFAAFLRCCEASEAVSRIMKNSKEARMAYLDALTLAKEADSRSFAPRVAGQSDVWFFPMRDWPLKF